VRRLFLTAWIIWLLDFSTKIWAVENLSPTPKKILGSLLQLTLIRNSGAAFSFATGATVVLTVLALLVAGAIVFYAPRVTSAPWLSVGGLVLGGVTGNLTDRIFRAPGFFIGHVVDWIEVPHWPVFNIADSAIFIAACIAFLLSVRNIAPITPLK
jgi:signal peptidase II